MSILFSPASPMVLSDIFLEADKIVPVSPLSLSPVFSILSPKPLTLSFEFDRPMVGVYETIDNDPDVRKKMVNYYYDLIRDDWLLDDLNDILNYFHYKDGKVEMIHKIDEYSPSNINKDTDKIAEKKVEFIEKNIFTKNDLKHVLRKFVKETSSKWVLLPKNEFFLKKVIKEYILKDIRKKLH